jgi:beta-N-acetylhexosaminidase
MKKLFFLLCTLCLLATACVRSAGPAPTLPVLQPEPALTSTAAATEAQATQTLPPTSVDVDGLYLPLMADDSQGMTPQDWVEATLAGMSLEEKIGQLIITGVEGDTFTPETCRYIQQLRPAGITLGGDNLPDLESLSLFTAGMQACAQQAGMPPLLVTLAHEGEYVDRFRSGTTTFPSALALGATGDPQTAYQAALASGQELAYAGVNLILGPVADVLTNYDNEVISQRAYGGDVDQVSRYVTQAVQGYLQAGLIPVLKHFPGHGGVSGDSHRILPVDRAGLDQIRAEYLPPFQAGLEAGASVVMLTHVSFPVLEGGAEFPATLSKGAVSLLRDELGFEGVILSDAMRMKAVTQVMTSAEASLQGVQAGVDLLLATQPDEAQETFAWLLDGYRQGRLTDERIDEAVRRVLAIKSRRNLVSPLQEGEAPDWQAHQELAYKIGEQAVALLKNNVGMVPLSEGLSSILIIGPDEDWDLYTAMEARLKDSGITPAFARYPVPWGGKIEADELLSELPARAVGYDVVLLFTWQVHLNRLDYEDTWQVELVNNLRQTGVPLVIVAIKSPTDILEIPQVGTYLAMFGTTPGQEGALVDILLGRMQPQGGNPLPGLLP